MNTMLLKITNLIPDEGKNVVKVRSVEIQKPTWRNNNI